MVYSLMGSRPGDEHTLGMAHFTLPFTVLHRGSNHLPCLLLPPESAISQTKGYSNETLINLILMQLQ